MCIRLKSCCFGCCKLEKGVSLMAKVCAVLAAIFLFLAIRNKETIWSMSTNFLGLTTNVLLLIGVYRRNRFFALPWLIVDACGFVISFGWMAYMAYHAISVGGEYELLEPYIPVKVDTSKLSKEELREGYRWSVTSFYLTLVPSVVVGLYLFMLVYSYYRELADEAEEASRVFQDSMVTSRSGGGSIMNLNMRIGGGGSGSNRNVYAPEPTPGASIFPMQASMGFQNKPPMMPPQQQQMVDYQMSPTPVMSATPDLNAPPPAYNYGGYYCPE